MLNILILKCCETELILIVYLRKMIDGRKTKSLREILCQSKFVYIMEELQRKLLEKEK